MLNLVWRDSARNDVRSIVTFIAGHDIAAAERLKAAIQDCVERLPDHPFMYRPGRAAGTREAVVHPNYLVVYRVTSDAVEVVSVIHARQRYPE